MIILVFYFNLKIEKNLNNKILKFIIKIMSLVAQKDFLKSIKQITRIVRFRSKINIKKPKPPHFERAKFLELTKPIFINPKRDIPLIELCQKNINFYKKEDERNPLQEIFAKELYDRFNNSNLIIFYHKNSMTGDEEFKAFAKFKKEKMFLKTYGKKTIEMAVRDTRYEPILDFFISSNMILFSPTTDIKKILKIAAIYNGKLINKDQLMELSLMQNIETAQSGLVQTLNLFGLNLVKNLNSIQNDLVINLQERTKQLEIEEKK